MKYALFVGLIALVGVACSSRAVSPTVPVNKEAIVATAQKRVTVYYAPNTNNPFRSYSKTNSWGQPRVFLVNQRIPGWENVYLPMRPNDVTGWIKDSNVSLSYDPYRIIVSLKKHFIGVFKQKSLLFKAKAGVGRLKTPTPRGIYYLVELLKQPTSSTVYGPYAFGTSAFSNVFFSFGGGPGQIGLHGTDFPAGLGHNVSHGCIRIPNWLIIRLAHLLPLGTPIIIK